jgi:hypothetical protein
MRNIRIALLLLPACSTILHGDDAATPVAAVSVNGAASISLNRGWPMLLRLGVRHLGLLQPPVQPIPLAATDGASPWTNAVHLQLLDANNNTASITFTPAGDTPPSQVILDAQTIASALWTVAPDQTAQLAAGAYTLAAAIDWNGGRILAAPVRIDVQDPPDPPDPRQESRRVRLLANFALWNGDSAGARATVEQALAAAPDDIHLLELEGDIWAAGGDFARAFVYYSAAAQAFENASPAPREAPGDLYQKRMNAMIQFAGADQ